MTQVNKQLYNKLKYMDWYYEYSDDPNVYHVGRQNMSQLKNLIRDLFKSDHERTIETILEFIREVRKKAAYYDMHIYLTPLRSVTSEEGYNLEDDN